MNLPYKNVRDLVKIMRDRYFKEYSVLPYNRFDIEHSSFWWLSPTSEKAAFRYGKAIFTTEPAFIDDDDLFCGLHVEKGLASGGTYPNFDMDETWFWHTFAGLADQPLKKAVGETCGELGELLRIIVTAEVQQDKLGRSVVDYQTGGTGLLLKNYQKGDGVLAGLETFIEFSQLAKSLRLFADDMEEYGWHWVSVLVGKSFTLDPSGSDDLPQCAEMLSGFQDWMRGSAMT